MSRAFSAPTIVLCVALAILAPTPATSQTVVVDGGVPSGDAGWLVSDDFRSATTFTVAPGGISFNAVRFWGMLLTSTGSYTPDMYWQILGDVGGSPDNTSLIAQGHAEATATERGTSTLWPDYTSWQFDFATGVQSLDAGTFWLALHDGVLDPASPDYTYSDLMWEMTDGGSPFFSEPISEGGWGQYGDRSLAFQLLDTRQVVATPEPASLLLLGTGLTAIIIGVRRRGSA